MAILDKNLLAKNGFKNLKDLPIEIKGEAYLYSKQEPYTYLLDSDQQLALHTACATQRPLLVVGEPGIGKSQFALAAACGLEWAYEMHTVSARTEVEELLWNFDAVARLSKAQALGVVQDPKMLQEWVDTQLNAARFLQPGCLWRGINPESAAAYPMENPSFKASQQPGTVVLIDEIDKADAEVPNGILDVMDRLEFHCPHLPADKNNPRAQWVGLAEGRGAPLLVFTSNQERDLPAAFVRRCVVLRMQPDKDIKSWAVERGQAHFNEHPVVTPQVMKKAADFLVEDRERATHGDKPGLAEYLDLLTAIASLCANGEQATSALNGLRQYTLAKHQHLYEQH